LLELWRGLLGYSGFALSLNWCYLFQVDNRIMFEPAGILIVDGLGSLSLRNFDRNLDRGIVSRNIGHVFIAQALDDFQHHSVLALSDLVGH
jgi:hypothetical protein